MENNIIIAKATETTLREQIKKVLVQKDVNEEIYSAEELNHEKALVEYLKEQGVLLTSSDVVVRMETPYIDGDGYAGVRSIITIVPVQLDVYVDAYHHRKWDYYMFQVKDSELGIKPHYPDVILMQTELEGGLKKNSLSSLLTLMNYEEEYIPFEASENNTSAYGFLKATTLEEQDYNTSEIKKFVEKIIGNLTEESHDNFYKMPNGTTLYIGYSI